MSTEAIERLETKIAYLERANNELSDVVYRQQREIQGLLAKMESLSERVSSMPAAGMLGSAIGAGAPTVVANSGVRGRLTPLKDLKGKQSPEQLKRLVAQISEKPESVQHHTVDQDGLDSLLEQLAKKPGIHAVHLSKGGKAKVVPSDAQ